LALSSERMQAGSTRSAEHALFRRCAGGDGAARDELILLYMPLAHRLARRYWFKREPLDDLLQVARMALVKAVDRFDFERGMPFSAFAVPTIIGELKRHFRDTCWALHVPQRVQERAQLVERSGEELRRRLGRAPSAAEISSLTGLDEDEVLEAAEAVTAIDAVSFESRARGGHEDGDSYHESVGANDERYELVEYGASLGPALHLLPERERTILRLRFVDDMTQFEIAREMGISQMHVSRLIRHALARLREITGSDEAA